MYDFHKKTRSINEIVFFHESFQEGNKDILSRITRKSNPCFPATDNHQSATQNSASALHKTSILRKEVTQGLKDIEESKDTNQS